MYLQIHFCLHYQIKNQDGVSGVVQSVMWLRIDIQEPVFALNSLAPEFSLKFEHSVFKMWILQEPKKDSIMK